MSEAVAVQGPLLSDCRHTDKASDKRRPDLRLPQIVQRRYPLRGHLVDVLIHHMRAGQAIRRRDNRANAGGRRKPTAGVRSTRRLSWLRGLEYRVPKGPAGLLHRGCCKHRPFLFHVRRPAGGGRLAGRRRVGLLGFGGLWRGAEAVDRGLATERELAAGGGRRERRPVPQRRGAAGGAGGDGGVSSSLLPWRRVVDGRANGGGSGPERTLAEVAGRPGGRRAPEPAVSRGEGAQGLPPARVLLVRTVAAGAGPAADRTRGSLRCSAPGAKQRAGLREEAPAALRRGRRLVHGPGGSAARPWAAPAATLLLRDSLLLVRPADRHRPQLAGCIDGTMGRGCAVRPEGLRVCRGCSLRGAEQREVSSAPVLVLVLALALAHEPAALPPEPSLGLGALL
jgi:hypothetical protein